MMLAENTNIDSGDLDKVNIGQAKVNIGILRLTSHHVQCLNSLRLLYNFSKQKK